MGDIHPVDILIYMINFFVTFLLLYLLLYKPVSKFLSGRRERIADSLRDAEEARKQAEGILLEAKAELASTGEKSAQLAHETIESAADAAEKIMDNAQEKAAAILVRAREQMEEERQMALERAFTDLVSFTGSLASRVLTREVNIEDNRAIVDQFFAENNEAIKRGGRTQVANKPEDTSPAKQEEPL